MLAIDDVQYVNIIKAGQTLSFAENGVTVVYGDNGSGKSGYSRILKLACHARDKDDRILPDIFATTPNGTPAAKLKIKQDSEPDEIVWTHGHPTDPILTNIAVFDGRCARVITDDRNEITYLPYGCDVFQKTADIVIRVKADILSRHYRVDAGSGLRCSGGHPFGHVSQVIVRDHYRRGVPNSYDLDPETI